MSDTLLDLDPATRRVIEAITSRFTSASYIEHREGTAGLILIMKHPVNISPERFVAKTINPRHSPNRPSPEGEALRRFEHEIQQWFALRHHPSVLTPFYFEHLDGALPYVVTAYCEVSVRDYLGCPSWHTEQEAFSIAIQLCHSLNYAHRMGMIAHQDLKPENVLLSDIRERFSLPPDYPLRWQVKLADFGLANGYSALGIRSGSRPYSALEQYGHADAGAVTAATDVFAVGVMLCELFTGKHPLGMVTSDVWPHPGPGQPNKWRHEDIWKGWARRGTIEAGVKSGLPLNIRPIVERMTASSPADRPCLRDVEDALFQALKDCHPSAAENLRLFLTDFDTMAVESEDIDPRPTIEYVREERLRFEGNR